MFQRIIPVLCLFILPSFLSGQPAGINPFPMDDSLLKKQIYQAAFRDKEALLASLTGEHKDDYKEVYESRFEMLGTFLKSNRLVAEPDAQRYLQSLLDHIVSVNPELKNFSIRLVFSRDWWANAYSVGEGTLIVNAGLLVRMKNEAELAFVLCHELAHLYLDHSGKSIQRSISTLKSEEFRKELKRLSRQEYGAGAELDKLLKVLAFNSRRHNREHESEADFRAAAFLKATGFSGYGAISCLELLDKVDETPLYPSLNIQQVFNYPDYSFKTRWIKKEAVIFGQMQGDASGLTAAEKDSLRTHPDCQKRLRALEPLLSPLPEGNAFVLDSMMFRKLQERFSLELIESLYQEEEYARNLYLSLGLLQSGRHRNYAVYAVARVLNELYEAQAKHYFGRVTEKENRTYDEDYNLLLRLLDRVRLNELAELAYHFCLQYRAEMAGYTPFEEAWRIAKQNKDKHTS